MTGTVISVNPDASGVSAAGRKYSYCELKVQTSNGEKAYKVFPRDPFRDEVLRLKPGDNIEIKFDTSGRFPVMKEVRKIDAGGNSGGGFVSDAERQDSITKSVALKAAVDYCKDAPITDVLKTSQIFEAYLKGDAPDDILDAFFGGSVDVVDDDEEEAF